MLCGKSRVVVLTICSRFTVGPGGLQSVIQRFASASAKPCETAANSFRRMRVLNVAEKNDAAKGIAGFLSNGNLHRKEGRSQYNKIYEFNYRVDGRDCQMAMTSVSGHLLQHEFSTAYRKWMSCNPHALFEAPVQKICSEEYQPVKETLESEARRSDILIIWTDCDREGENIGFEIISVCQAVNPNLIVKRAKFSEITKQSVTRAMSQLGEPDKRQSDAVDVRQELDLRIGAAFTRFQTLRLKKVFPQTLQNNLISYGSCQFPTLGFVVERYNAIEKFIPEPFWKLKVFQDWERGRAEFSWDRGRLFDQMATRVFLDTCLANPQATVTSVKTKPKSKFRPQPLDTIELEKSASRKLKINAKETMRLAERLYTQGFISYPRTETTIFPKDLNLVALVQAHTAHPDWGGFAARVLEQGPRPRQGAKSDQAHPPIHPLKAAPGLQGNEARVYEFIVRHFLACVSADAKGLETSIDIDIGGEKFSASGLTILERNYLEVYPYDKWSDKELPVMEEGQVFEPTSIEMAAGETSAPPLLTEADLISLMEKHGIGTDATHADHIETVKSRLYVGLVENKFIPGELGMGLVQGYDSMGFQMSKPNWRAELEADLKRICDGLRDPAEVLAEQVAKYRELFEKSVADAMKLDEALSKYFGDAVPLPNGEVFGHGAPPPPIMKCPRCHSGDILLRSKPLNGQAGVRRFYASCSRFPECRAAMWMPLYDVLDAKVSPDKCTRCPSSPHLLEMDFRPGAFPLLPVHLKACLGGCDSNFMEQLGIHPIRPDGGNYQGTGSSVRPPPPRNPQASTTRPPPRNPQAPTTRPVAAAFPLRRSLPAQPPATAAPRSTSDGAIVCNCNKDAPLITVRKEGPNKGRKFYTCPDKVCNFFMWAEGDVSAQPTHRPLTEGGANAATRTGPPAPSMVNNGTEKCACGLDAVRRTVLREGLNQGREFFVCPKPREEQCNFFAWADGPSVTDGNGRGGGRTAPRGRGTGTTKAPKRCGICKETGHTARTCPQK